MSVKAVRTYAVRLPADSFAAYMEARDDSEMDHWEEERVTREVEEDICWIDFGPVDTPRRKLSHWDLFDEVSAAWYDRDWSTIDPYDDFWELSIKPMFAPSKSETLQDRIWDAFPDDRYKQLTKKRRGLDREPRYERRDGSPRSKVARSVDKWHNDALRCKDRRALAQTLDAMAHGVPADTILANGILADVMIYSTEGHIAGWDTGLPTRSHQA